jgi:hypothetical protein
MLFILAIVVILALVGGLAKWPQSSGGSSYPKTGMGFAVIFVLTLLLLRHL